jgi:site-specific DNA-methyltransferase (adenine-specific)/modification methylase
MSNANLINKLILGDCLEVMQEIDDKSVDLILCDLPCISLIE